MADMRIEYDNPGIGPEVTHKLMNYDAVKESLQICLCDTQENQERLSNLVHTEHSDCSATYHVNLQETEVGTASVAVTQELLETWGVSGASKTVSIKYPDTSKKITTVGVLDNGIEAIDELKPWIDGKRVSPYPDSSILASHGSIVAGVITYGDELQEKDICDSDNVMVFDATVFPDTRKERLDEDELIENVG